MLKDKGTILRLHPLGEHGSIVTWSTEQHGIIRTAARQARKAGSELCGIVDLFHECELVYKEARPGTGDLHTLSSASILNPRLPLRSQLSRLHLAAYMARLLLATTEQENSNESPEWHHLITQALDYTCTAPLRPAILLHFEKRLAQLHGLYHPEAGSPHHCLLRHFQHLPSGRAELLLRLEKA